MNYQQVLALIQQFIVANGNNEITANVLRPILEAILAQPNEFIGDLDDLQTDDRTNLVAAINSLLSGSSSFGGSTKIHYLPLNGVDVSQPELSYIAEAVKIHGPFVSELSQQMVFKTISTVGTQQNGYIVTRYYRLLKNLASVGGGGLNQQDVLPSWFMPDGEGMYQNPEDEGVIAELGDIGIAEVWDVFNLGNAGEAWDMELYRFVRATQNGEIKLWAFTGLERFYGGPDMIVEPDIYEAFESDFFDITNEPSTPNPDFTFHVYDDIDELIIRQAEQTPGDLILVKDAVDDSGITFDASETRRQAMYRLKSTVKTGTLSDYTLVATPYGNGGTFDPTPLENAIQNLEDNKVDKEAGKGLSQENYTTAEKNKLAGLESSKWRGLYLSKSALELANPTPAGGDYADVDAGTGVDTIRYVYDETDAQWIESGSGSPLTGAQIKVLYEGEPDTNAFDDARKNKLDSITAIFTTALKTAYDNVVTWISTNGQNVLDHINSPHAPANAQPNDPNTTLEGNTFNGANQLLKLDAQGEFSAEKISGLGNKVLEEIGVFEENDIAALVAGTYTTGSEVKVLDASGDTNLIFPTGASKIAFYKKLNSTNADLTDWQLISAPYAVQKENYLTLNPAREIDMSNPAINKYNFDSPIDAVSFLTVNAVVGGKAIVRLNTNTANSPNSVTVNGTLTGRICGIDNWYDSTDMEIYLEQTPSGLEWWYYTKQR